MPSENYLYARNTWTTAPGRRGRAGADRDGRCVAAYPDSAVVVVDFGIALDRREVILHPLREAGRAGAAGGLDAADLETVIKNRAVDESDGVLDASNVTVCYVDDPIEPGTTPGTREMRSALRSYEFKLSASGGEILTATGITFPTLDISPTGEALLLKPVTGASQCPP
jgi:hypothetical protein